MDLDLDLKKGIVLFNTTPGRYKDIMVHFTGGPKGLYSRNVIYPFDNFFQEKVKKLENLFLRKK